MTFGLRIVLVVVSILSCFFVVSRIRKAQIRIEDTLFWLIVAVGTLLLGIVPQIAFYMAKWIGIQSPVNFVYLVFIFVLLFKTFILTVQVSQLQEKIKNLAQNIAIQNNEKIEKNKEHGGR